MLVDTIDVYPNLDENGNLNGFTGTGSLQEIPPKPIMEALDKLAAQINTEREIVEGS